MQENQLPSGNNEEKLVEQNEQEDLTEAVGPPFELFCCVCCKECPKPHTCVQCKNIAHSSCSDSAGEGFEKQITCQQCLNENAIEKNRKKSYEGQVKTAQVMLDTSNAIFNDIEIGFFVVLYVPKFDRGPLDKKNLEGIIFDKKWMSTKLEQKQVY